MERLTACPLCGGRVASRRTEIDQPVRLRETVRLSWRVTTCSNCGERFFGPGEMEAMQRAAAQVVRDREGLLAPEEIRAIRESMHLTQAAFERLLRVGAKTVVRWERGTSFQNRATDTLLRVLRAVPQARAFVHELGDADAHAGAPASS